MSLPITTSTLPAIQVEEPILAQDSFVTITSSRAIFGSHTYPVRNITSVRISKVPPSRGAGIGLMMASVMFILVGLRFRLPELYFIGVGLAILGVWLLSRAKWIYQLRVGNSGTEFIGTSSYSESYIRNLHEALSHAIVNYR